VKRRRNAMRGMRFLPLFIMLVVIPCVSFADFRPGEYQPMTQVDLMKDPESHAGKKVSVSDTFQFCGSDFCVDLRKKNIETREYYCFALGPLCMIRMYIKKDHPDAAQLKDLRKGDRLAVFGTFDLLGSNYRFILVDRLIVEKGPSR
jgi:hypothetical protein